MVTTSIHADWTPGKFYIAVMYIYIRCIGTAVSKYVNIPTWLSGKLQNSKSDSSSFNITDTVPSNAENRNTLSLYITFIMQ